MRALRDKNGVLTRTGSVNCYWIVCRIGVGLEYSPGLRPDTPGRPQGIADPRLHGRGLASLGQGMECTGNVRRARSADNPRTMNLELLNEAAATAHEELASITGNEHYSSSKRLLTLKASFAKLSRSPSASLCRCHLLRSAHLQGLDPRGSRVKH